MPKGIFKRTKEHCKNIGKALMGKIVSPQIRENISKNHADVSGKNNPMYGNPRMDLQKKFKGNGNPSWKGGLTPLHSRIKGCFEYKNWRKQVFRQDNYTCQECGDNKGGNLNAHHKKPFAQILSEFLKEYDQFSPIEDKETLLRLTIKYKPFWDITNGKTLCENCHILTMKGRRVRYGIR